MKTAEYWIEHLNLTKHPEGGYFKECFRSIEFIKQSHLPDRYTEKHCFLTSIYFLLKGKDISAFHRLKSDEIWYYHDGSPLTAYMIDKKGKLSIEKLGCDMDKGEKPQIMFTQEVWFGAKVDNINQYTLMGCSVAPGFEFSDFEMAEKEKLIKLYPDHQQIIEMLTY